MSAPARRAAAIDRLDGSSVDLLVVGSGIVGSRIAYDAARHGLGVALIDAGDFGGATSSASSKLVHGGLRYLSTGDVRLVRQLQVERRVLMTSVAPHLVRPLQLLVAVEREHAPRSLSLVAGLAMYAAIGGPGQTLPRFVRPEGARRAVPALHPPAVSCCGLVPEAQGDDARLTLATVRAAAAAGATTLNYVRLVSFEHARGKIVHATLEDVDSGIALSVHRRAVVNATGPWIDHVRKLDRPAAPGLARLSKGVHALLPLDRPWPAGLALFDNSRTAIAVPWQGMLLVGATDTEYDGYPGDLRADAGEIEALLAPLARLLDDPGFHAGRVVHSFAGLRVLPRGKGDTARALRHHLVETSPSGLVSIAGGKLTTHRTIAADALRRLPTEVRPRRIDTAPGALPGANGSAGVSRQPVDPELADHLRRLYGSDERRVLAYADSWPDALERIHPAGPDVLAQAYFARDAEYALAVDDIVSRRTTLAVRGLADAAVRGRIAEVLAGRSYRATSSSPSSERASPRPSARSVYQ